jgi:hypothetical protein
MTPSDWVVLIEGEDHVIPRDDDIDHIVSRGCVCGPAVVEVDTRHGVAYQVTHHSLDGREIT